MYITILQEERVQHTVLSMALALRRDTFESYLLAIVPYEYLWKKICLLKLYVTAQKMKFSVKDFFSNVTKSAVSCGFGHIYWRNPSWKASIFVQCCNTTLIILILIFSQNLTFMKVCIGDIRYYMQHFSISANAWN